VVEGKIDIVTGNEKGKREEWSKRKGPERGGEPKLEVE